MKPLLTVVDMRLSNHTLDGIVDVVGLFFFNRGGLGNITSQKLDVVLECADLLFVVGHLSL